MINQMVLVFYGLFLGALFFPIGFVIGLPFGCGMDVGEIFFVMVAFSVAFLQPKRNMMGKKIP